MRCGAGLCVLGLLYLHGWVSGQEDKVAEVQPGVLVFCDDPAVATAVSDALTTFNKQASSGNKLALYRILSATKSENGSSSVYSIQFSSRISDCPVQGDKLWSECDYLPSGSKEPSLCSAIVYVTGTDIETKGVECKLDHVITPERSACLGCPTEISVDSEDLKVPLSVSIAKYNSISDSTHLFMLQTVAYATRQVVAGFRYKLTFDMRKSTCPKSEHKDVNDVCVPNKDDVELANCNSTVDVAPWRHEVPEANIECGPGPVDFQETFTRRRPPGWSPLRNVVNFEAASETAGSPSTTAAAPAPVKESSEEEDPASSKAPPASSDTPFHCPSKPWKEFSIAAPTAAEPAPTVEGALTDLDLLG